jgi:hypothetical protein
MLRRWLDEHQEDAAFLLDLSSTAKQWEAKGRPAGLVWRGDAAEEARRWYTAHPRVLPARDQAFIEAVLALGRRNRLMKRIALASVFTVLASFGIGASIAYVRVKNAEGNAREAASLAQRKTDEVTTALNKILEVERKRKAAESEAQLAEADRAKAEAERAKAEAAEKAKSLDLALSREQLVAKNAELEVSVKDAKAAKERAETASKKAEAAAAEEKRAKDALKVLLEAERARVKKLQDEMRKMSTQLKE